MALPTGPLASYETAAPVVNYTTAVTALEVIGGLPPDGAALVHGAAGGLGHAFGQVIAATSQARAATSCWSRSRLHTTTSWARRQRHACGTTCEPGDTE
jgi:NADPH:quinone reductase-like Zn-dependent oxidoreductase